MKKYLSTLVILVAWQTGAYAQSMVKADWLISPQDAQVFKGEEGFNEPPALQARALMPIIEIIKPVPASDMKVKAPFSIDVLFKPHIDAAIDPSTFRVLYGALRVDITSRITKFVKVTAAGFSLDNAQIPIGKHRMVMQVQDEKQRVAERELKFEVE